MKKTITAISIVAMLMIPSFITVQALRKDSVIISNGGTTLYVGGDGSGNYTCIQDAIDNASDDDTVFVYNGTYFENIIVDKSIELTGENKEITVIDGDGSGDVVDISANQVNLTGFTIQNGYDGISVNSNYNSISENTITDNDHHGIQLYGSSGNRISRNTIMNNKNIGINLIWYSSNNIISCDTITNNGYGIYLHWSSNNTICWNTITNSNRDGIHLYWSSDTNITGNNVTDNHRGFYLWYASNLIVSENIITNNELGGISIDDSYNNVIIENLFVSNGIDLWGDLLRYYNTHTIENNTVNGRPIRYYKNMNDVVVPEDTAQVILANCTNFTIQNLNLSDAENGVQLAFSSHNIISDNIINDNDNIGIHLMWYSSNNTIIRNNITKNGRSGIYLATSSNNNYIYHNYFNNTQNVYEYCLNIWDNSYPSGGNYWSDYTGSDVNGDGIGDIPYNISGDSNQDHYPLINPWTGIEPTPNYGDCNTDGTLNLGDVVYLINYLFRGGPPPMPADCVGDCNADGAVDVGDVVYLINYLFRGGLEPGGCCE